DNPVKFQLKDKLYRENNADYLKEYDAIRARKLKVEVLSKYGDVCECCAESIIEFLTIDHIGGNGGQHRREVGYGTTFYKWLRDNNYPSGYRILCMNCNFSYGLKGYCPHKSGTRF